MRDKVLGISKIKGLCLKFNRFQQLIFYPLSFLLSRSGLRFLVSFFIFSFFTFQWTLFKGLRKEFRKNLISNQDFIAYPDYLLSALVTKNFAEASERNSPSCQGTEFECTEAALKRLFDMKRHHQLRKKHLENQLQADIEEKRVEYNQAISNLIAKNKAFLDRENIELNQLIDYEREQKNQLNQLVFFKTQIKPPLKFIRFFPYQHPLFQSSDLNWNYLVSFSSKNFHILNLKTNSTLAQFPHKEIIKEVIISSKDHLVITGSGNLVRIFDLLTGQEVGQHEISHPISGLAFSSETNKIALAAFNTFYVFEMSKNKASSSVDTSPDVSISFEENPSLFQSHQSFSFSLDLDGFIQQESSILDMEFTYDGRKFITGNQEKVQIFDSSNYDIIKTFSKNNSILDGSPILELKTLKNKPTLLARSESGLLYLINLDEENSIQSFSYDGSKISTFAVSKDESQLALGSDKGGVRIINLVDLEPFHLNSFLGQFSSHGSALEELLFSSDGKRLLTVDGKRLLTVDQSYVDQKSYFVRIFDLETGVLLHRFPHRSHISSVSFSLDNNRVITGDENGHLRVFELVSKPILCKASGDTDPTEEVTGENP